MMDSQQEYEALLKQWGFESDSQDTANSFYEFTKKTHAFVSKLISKSKAVFQVKSQNPQLSLNT
ncbi:hypothetical protein OA92_05500 [Marinomonas sp. SBI22]|uniref:hypothetical protein n=1 Tax=unclassified Marinomonas TaxID=196814 RepID=UPI0007BC43FA|nr:MULTISPECIES: hypothetical protein [unclassified Marinomonas]KZM44155.1 hypothetical protein OA92_05500 [Marinomonas sp. SBI22]